MFCNKIIYFCFAIYFTTASAETYNCSIPENEPHLEYYINSNNQLNATCENGYKYFNNGDIKCVNGQWIGVKPNCVKGGCPKDFVQPQHGRIIGDDEKVRIVCNDSYLLAGQEWSYCNGTHWDRPLGKCLLNSTVSIYECNFDMSSCGWIPGKSRYWSVETAIDEFGNFSAGPTHDHTTMKSNDGYYIVMKSRGKADINALLYSPFYNRTLSLKRSCFSFYYFMYGEGVNGFSVYVKPKSVPMLKLLKSNQYLQFKKSGPQVKSWKQGTFDIPEMKEDFQIVIVAKTSSHPLSDIAIDDVKLSFGSECVKETTTTTTTEEC